MDQTNGGPRTMLARRRGDGPPAPIVHGMVVYDHLDLAAEQSGARVARPAARRRLHSAARTATRGWTSAPEAFARLMSGRNHGKVVVQVADLD